MFSSFTPVPDFLSLKHRGMAMDRVVMAMLIKVLVTELADLQPIKCVKQCVGAANVGLLGVGSALFARDILFNGLRWLFVTFAPVGGSGEWLCSTDAHPAVVCAPDDTFVDMPVQTEKRFLCCCAIAHDLRSLLSSSYFLAGS